MCVMQLDDPESSSDIGVISHGLRYTSVTNGRVASASWGAHGVVDSDRSFAREIPNRTTLFHSKPSRRRAACREAVAYELSAFSR